MMMKRWQANVFLKLITIFIIVISSLYIGSMLINSASVGSVRREISKSALSSVNFQLDTIEAEVGRITHSVLETADDNDFIYLSILEDSTPQYERTMAINNVWSKLEYMVSIAQPYVKNASIYIPSRNQAFSYLRRYYTPSGEEMDRLQKLFHKTSFSIVYDKHWRQIVCAYPLVYGNNAPMFIVTVELSFDKLVQDMLARFSDYKDSGYMLINPESQWYITNDKRNAILPVVNRILEKTRQGERKGTVTEKVGSDAFLFNYRRSEILGMTLFSFIPEKVIMNDLYKYRTWFWLISVGAVILVLLFSLSIYEIIHRPLRTLIASFKKVDEGDLDISVQYSRKDEFRFLYDHFNATVEKLKRLVGEVYEERLLVQDAELKKLQSQINPHFLYNCFYILYRMVEPLGEPLVEKFCLSLGRYFEFITRSNTDEVPLSMEMEYARVYSDIQSIRFSNRIQVVFDTLPPGMEKRKVPRMIVQPLIENAYKHGLYNKLEQGLIAVKTAMVDDKLHISVEDNGDEMDDPVIERIRNSLENVQSPSESMGLTNVHRRLLLKFGPASGLYVTRGQSGGLKVDVIIPAGEGEAYVQDVDRG